MQPDTLLAGDSAIQAVHTSGDDKSPIGRVLMPGHEAGVVRLLDEERGAPDQEVRTKHILDCVEHARMANKFVDPGE